MKKLIYTIFCLFCIFSSNAQKNITIHGEIINATTSQPVPFANIQILQKAIGVSSNVNGAFTFQLPMKYKNDKLVVSCIGYENYEFLINKKSSKSKINIALTPKNYEIKEVNIKYIDPLKIIKKAINNISKNFSKQDAYLKAYYREMLKEDGKYINYTDAACTIYYGRYKKHFNEKKSKIKNLFYNKIRATSLPDNFGTPINLCPGKWDYPPSSKDLVKVDAIRSSENYYTTHIFPIIGGGILPITATDKAKYRYKSMFLHKNNFDKYHYTLAGITNFNNSKVYVIKFEPSKGSVKTYFKGKIYIEEKSFAIVSCDYSLIQQHPKIKLDIIFGSPLIYYSNPSKNIDTLILSDYHVIINYKQVGERWFLSKIHRMMEYNLEFSKYYIFKKIRPALKFTAYEDLLVNDIIVNNNVKKFSKDSRDSILYCNLISSTNSFHQNYNKAFWDAYNKIQPTHLEDSIRKGLEKRKPLELQFSERFKVNDSLKPPVAKKQYYVDTIHNEIRVDYYKWLHNLTNPEVMKYIENEYNYSNNYLQKHFNLQSKLFNEISDRNFKSEDSTETQDVDTLATQKKYIYYTEKRKDKKYPLLYRKNNETLKKQLLIDFNKIQISTPFFHIVDFVVSPDNKFLVYSKFIPGKINSDAFLYDINDCNIVDTLFNVSSIVWSNINNFFYYCTDSLSHDTVFEYKVNDDYNKQKKIILTTKEPNTVFELMKSNSGKYIFIYKSKGNANGYYYRLSDLSDNGFRLISPIKNNVHYNIQYKNKLFYIYTNENAPNGKIMCANINKLEKENWKTFVPHNNKILICENHFFKDYYVIVEKQNMQNRINVISLKEKNKQYYIPFDKEEIYSVHFSYSQDYNSNILKLTYSSYVTPNIEYEFNLDTKELKKIKQLTINDYKPERYEVKRIWAASVDSVKIPITLFYKKRCLKKNEKTPILLNAYGCYGLGEEPSFNADLFSLLDRGVVYAVAHVRGGSELGNMWHKNAIKENKKNSFNDFVECAKYLISENYTSPKYLSAYGSSSGGLLMGVVANNYPELFNSIILVVPQVDLLSSLLDSTNYSSTGNWREFGNPYQEKYYDYIKSYSPYDNIKKQSYPNMLFIGGVQDPKVKYWESAKTVAKLREYNTGKNTILMRPIFNASHNLGFDEVTQEWNFSFIYNFVLSNFNINK